MVPQPNPPLLLVHAALAAVALALGQGDVAEEARTAAAAPEPRFDTTGPLHFVLPASGSPQPPRIEDQVELERLLRGDPAIILSAGHVSLSNDGRLTPAGDHYWLHQGYYGGWTLELVAPDGVLIWTYPWLGTNPPGAAKELAQVARRELWHRALRQLGQAPGNLRLEGRFEVATESELASVQGRPAASLVERVGRREYGVCTGARRGAERGRDHGVILSLIVDNPGPDPLHLAVLSVAEDRHHALAFPPLAAAEGATRLEPGASLQILVRVGRDFLHVPDQPSRSERGMRDRFFLIASRQPCAYPSFREDRPPVIGAEGSPLERWVARDLDRTGDLLTSPRIRPDGLDPTQLGVTYVDLIVD